VVKGRMSFEGCVLLPRGKGAEDVWQLWWGRREGQWGIRSRKEYMANRWAFGPLGGA
jgi:hypothetical protein